MNDDWWGWESEEESSWERNVATHREMLEKI